MAKYTKAETAEALANLREWIKPGDTLYTICDNVSRSGMTRHIRVVLPIATRDGECKPGNNNGLNTTIDFIHPNHAIGVVLGMSRAKRGDGLIVGGCGMDMGFHLVNSLSHVLYPEYTCLGQGRCPSNYHVNYRRHVHCPANCYKVKLYPRETESSREDRRSAVVATPELAAARPDL